MYLSGKKQQQQQNKTKMYTKPPPHTKKQPNKTKVNKNPNNKNPTKPQPTDTSAKGDLQNRTICPEDNTTYITWDLTAE